MTTRETTKKAIIAGREQHLLEISASILIEEGLGALSMERLAEELNTAKGTIYNHFPNREEILLALSVQAVNKRQSMFDAASIYRSPSRYRMLAVGVACEIYVRSYPQFFLVENLVRHSVIWEKCSEQRRDLLRRQEHRCMSLVSGIVRDAIATGDLSIPAGMTPEEMTLSLWALTYGSYLLDATSPSLKDLGVESVFRTVRISSMKTLDGFGWQPLWTAEQHMQAVSAICQTVFEKEPTHDIVAEMESQLALETR